MLLGARAFTFTLEGTVFFRPVFDILTIRLVTAAKSLLPGKYYKISWSSLLEAFQAEDDDVNETRTVAVFSFYLNLPFAFLFLSLALAQQKLGKKGVLLLYSLNTKASYCVDSQNELSFLSSPPFVAYKR